MLVPKLSGGLSEPRFSPKRGGNHACLPFRSKSLCFPPEDRRVSEPVEGTSGLSSCQPLPHPPVAVAPVGVSRAALQGSKCAVAVGL